MDSITVHYAFEVATQDKFGDAYSEENEGRVDQFYRKNKELLTQIEAKAFSGYYDHMFFTPFAEDVLVASIDDHKNILIENNK